MQAQNESIKRELKMSKKVLAIAMATLMLVSIFSIMTPVQAATPSGVSVFLRPGVEDPYHPGWSHTLGTLRNTPEEVINHYLEYAVFAGGVGDLQFDITFEAPWQGGIIIWLPPDFEFVKPDGTLATTSSERRYNVWTDLTNDYNYIGVSKRNGWDASCPFCIRIRIGFSALQADDDANWYDGVMIDPGTYHVRLFNVKAPAVAGVYHFKMQFKGAGYESFTFDVNDWPILIVKNELNPAYVTGTVFLCGDLPCSFGVTGRYGKVLLDGTTPEGRSVSSVYYFGPEDDLADGVEDGAYSFWLFGVAPGTYTIYASASAFPKVTGERLDIVAGQSLHVKTLYLSWGPAITLTVWSKHGRGELPWGNLWQPPYGNNDPTAPVDPDNRKRPITIELFDSEGNQVIWGGPWLFTDPLSTSFTTTLGPDIGWTSLAPVLGGYSVDGFGAGGYKVEAYVTGYVMTDEDAWQREFTVSGTTHVQMDLRRSNWFEIWLHDIADSTLPTVPTTLVLAALDADGKEKGVLSVLVAPNGDFWFWDPGYASYGPQVNPNTGLPYNIMTDPLILEGWSYRYLYTQFEEDPAYRDYGFVPGTYDIALYMADMGDQTGALGYGPGLVGRGWYTIREGDPHSGTIALCYSPSMLSFRVRLNKLILTVRSVDWQAPAHERPWSFPGAIITFDIMDENGEVVESLAPDLWGVVQDDGTIGSYYAWRDDDLVNPPCPACDPPVLDTKLTVEFTGNDYGVLYGYGPDSGLAIDAIGAYPTHLEPGQYKYSVNTYGYVERRSFPAVLTLGGISDIQVDLIQGGQIRVYMDFLKEFVGVDFNGWVRVEVFNENDELVGASIYGMADPNPLALGAGQLAYLAWNPAFDWKVVYWEPAEGAGNDQAPEFGYGQRAYFSNYFWGAPALTFTGSPTNIPGYIKLDPVDAHRLEVPAGEQAAFDVFGFHHYFGGPSSRNEGLWANGFDTTNGAHQTEIGIRGSSSGPGIDGGGLYKVKVWAFGTDTFEDPLDPSHWQSYYMGWDLTSVEVPWGGFTELWVDLHQMGRLVGYAGWTDMYGNVRNMPWLHITATGETSAFASTTPMFFGPESYLTSEFAYVMWLAPGTYDMDAVVPGAELAFSAPSISPQAVSGGFSTSLDIGMIETGVPVPEFTVAPLVALSALAASLYVLRRRRK